MSNLKNLDLQSLNLGGDDGLDAINYFTSDPQVPYGKYSNDTDVVNILREGMAYYNVERVIEKTRFTRKDISDILHISTRQMSRYTADDLLSVEQSGLLYELSRLFLRGREVFGDQETFENWLARPHTAFGMQKPSDLLDTSEGFRMVNDLLSQIEYGFYS